MSRSSSVPWSLRVSAEQAQERRQIIEERDRFRRALELIGAPVDPAAFDDPTFKKVAILLSERMEIAGRALRGERLTTPPSPTLTDETTAKTSITERAK